MLRPAQIRQRTTAPKFKSYGPALARRPVDIENWSSHKKMDENPQTTIRTPNDFRVHIMEPDYAAFERAPTDLRIAFHAAASLFHLRDWIAFAQCVSPAQLQSELENRCDLFGVIRDVANASKHLRLKRHSTSVLDAGDIRVQEIGVTGYGVGPGGYGQASAYGPVPAIIIVPEGLLFADAARKVRQMWAQFFEERGW